MLSQSVENLPRLTDSIDEPAFVTENDVKSVTSQQTLSSIAAMKAHNLLKGKKDVRDQKNVQDPVHHEQFLVDLTIDIEKFNKNKTRKKSRFEENDSKVRVGSPHNRLDKSRHERDTTQKDVLNKHQYEDPMQMPEARYQTDDKQSKPRPDRSNNPQQRMNKGQEFDDVDDIANVTRLPVNQVTSILKTTPTRPAVSGD